MKNSHAQTAKVAGCGPEGNRTLDLYIANVALCLLSYRPMSLALEGWATLIRQMYKKISRRRSAKDSYTTNLCR